MDAAAMILLGLVAVGLVWLVDAGLWLLLGRLAPGTALGIRQRQRVALSRREVPALAMLTLLGGLLVVLIT